MLHGLLKRSANQRRRVETDRLTIELCSSVIADGNQGISIRQSWEMFVDSLVAGINDAAEYVGYLMPLLVLVFLLAGSWLRPAPEVCRLVALAYATQFTMLTAARMT